MVKTDLVLIDTSAWLAALRKDFIARVKERINLLLHNGRVVTLGIIKLELLGGTKSESEFRRLKEYLESLDYIEIGDSEWERAYEIAYLLRRKAITVPYTDILIAACAATNGCVLVHMDKHFDLIAKEVEVEVESYVSSP